MNIPEDDDIAQQISQRAAVLTGKINKICLSGEFSDTEVLAILTSLATVTALAITTMEQRPEMAEVFEDLGMSPQQYWELIFSDAHDKASESFKLRRNPQ